MTVEGGDPPRTVLIATDSFKTSVSASVAAAEIAAGWREVSQNDNLLLFPQADGGEGTLDALERVVPGARRRSAGWVTGPDGRPTAGEWLQLPDGVAVVELAQCSGLPLMLRPDALGASTRGLGEVISRALDDGAVSLIIALGGSASTDGGSGALSALGLTLVGHDGLALPDGGAALVGLVRLDQSALRAAPAGGVTLLTDVRSPLLGPDGAAAIFGPQKGATSAEVRILDAGLRRFVEKWPGSTSPATPGAGAAGGTAWGFASTWGASIMPGAEYLADLSGLSAAMTSADLVITGEGCCDSTSLNGKVVGQVIALARREKVPVNLVVGQLATVLDDDIVAVTLAELAESIEAAITDPRPQLRAAGRLLAQHRSLS